jgi:glycosyltransferase involved in cell wall biosynthesis
LATAVKSTSRVRPLVSVIITTRNSATSLMACLRSIHAQTYARIEVIVVDRDSTDGTAELAKRFTSRVYGQGPERSAQRNFGAIQANGVYLLFIDADMELSPTVVASCVAAIKDKAHPAAVTIPEISFGQGFWAHCKALERSYYNGVSWMESPRFMSATVFRQAGCYDERITGGEDWDLTVRLRSLGPFARITPVIYHNEGRLSLRSLMAKRLYYARGFSVYYAKGKGKSHNAADGLRLIGLFFSRPQAILRHPIRWCGMIIMRAGELSASAVGYVSVRRTNA